MVTKYVKVLEGKEINVRTGKIWKVKDVPSVWRAKVENIISKDGYIIVEDGTVELILEDKRKE